MHACDTSSRTLLDWLNWMYLFQHKHKPWPSQRRHAGLWLDCWVVLRQRPDVEQAVLNYRTRIFFTGASDPSPNSYSLKSFVIPPQWVIAMLLSPIWLKQTLSCGGNSTVFPFHLPFPNFLNKLRIIVSEKTCPCLSGGIVLLRFHNTHMVLI